MEIWGMNKQMIVNEERSRDGSRPSLFALRRSPEVGYPVLGVRGIMEWLTQTHMSFRAELAEFQAMVHERGQTLRQLPFAELRLQDTGEKVNLGSRTGTISVIVLSLPSGGIQVVVQGFLKYRFVPGSSVALDGFYKYPDERISPMRDDEFWDFS
jgi:hypothetical protein